MYIYIYIHIYTYICMYRDLEYARRELDVSKVARERGLQHVRLKKQAGSLRYLVTCL